MAEREKYGWDDDGDDGAEQILSAPSFNNTLNTPTSNPASTPPPTPPESPWGGPATSPYYGTPESGYGPGGVQNPAYTGPGATPPATGTDTTGTTGAGTGAPGSYQNTDWWSARGVPSSEIFDTKTGQLKAGWRRTAKGYERDGAGAGPQGGNYQAWFETLTRDLPPTPASLKSLEAQLKQHGIKVIDHAGGLIDKIQLPNGEVYDVIEAATPTGGKRWQFLRDAGTLDSIGRRLTSSLSADGHSVKAAGINRLIVDGRPYKIADAPTSPTWTPTFAQGTAPYTPGDIPMDDLEGFSMDEILARIQGPHDPGLDALVTNLMESPESLSPLMIETLKAKSAEELAGVATAQEADLRRFGFLTGNEDSTWLASERMRNQMGRDQSLIGSNRDIDIRAAETNLADRRAAAEVGTAYTAEKRNRVALAADTGLRAAAAKQDRLALREQVKQKAAELQLDADQLMQQYVVAQMEDLTRRYGIQVAADIDILRLSQMGQQFQEDLAFKLSELDQRMGLAYDQLDQDDDQFGANLSWQVKKDQLDRDERNQPVAPGK